MCFRHAVYAFHLIVKGLTVCSFSGSFLVRLTVLPLQGFEVTHPIFEISMTLIREHGCQMLFTTFCQTIILTAKHLLKRQI